MTNKTPEIAAIETMLQAMIPMIIKCGDMTTEALKAAKSGHRNLAIGTVLPVEATLKDLQGLVAAMLILHRNNP